MSFVDVARRFAVGGSARDRSSVARRLVLRRSVGADPITDEELFLGDVSPSLLLNGSALPPVFRRIGDGRITIGDVVVALQVSVGAKTVVDQ